jgi:hypothetical protein
MVAILRGRKCWCCAFSHFDRRRNDNPAAGSPTFRVSRNWYVWQVGRVDAKGELPEARCLHSDFLPGISQFSAQYTRRQPYIDSIPATAAAEDEDDG